jgi:hypothetical protein
VSEAPLRATLKAGKDYDAPWLGVDGDNPDDLKAKLDYIQSSGVLDSLVGAANMLKAVNNVVSTGAAPAQAQAPAPQNNGWGQPQAQPQQQSAPPQNHGAQTHPEGLACHCGKLLEFGKTRTNKGQWKCPDYRWNNGSPNEHRLEWAN